MRMRLWPLLGNRVLVKKISFAGPDVKIYQRGNAFSFDDITARFAGDTTAVAATPEKTSKPWEIGIYDISIRNGRVFYKDLALDAEWGMNDLNLHIPGVYFSGEKTDVGAVLNFAEGGSLSTDVGYNIESSEFDIGIRLQDFALAGTLPYFRQSLDVTAVDGRLSADIRVDEVRRLKGFLHLSAADGGRRVVIVDAADDLNSAAANADGLIYDCMAAFYMACASFMSQNYGAGRPDRVKKSYFISLGYSFGVGLVLGAALFFCGPAFLALFTTETAVIDAGMKRVAVMAFAYGISAFMDCTIAASRGLGKTVVPTVIVVLGSCVFRVIWVYTIFAHFHTIPALYLLYPCSWILTALAEIAYFASCYKRAMAIFRKPAAA